MRKRIALITCTLLLAVLIAGYFIIIPVEKSVVIHAPMFNTTAELRKPAEWIKWHPTLTAACIDSNICSTVFDSSTNAFGIKSPQATINVSNRGPIFNVTETGDNNSSYVYTIIPSIKDDSTSILIEAKQSLLQALFTGFSSKCYAAAAIDSLKSFMETPAKYYGFNIQLKPVLDSDVVTTTRKVIAANQFAALHDMLTDVTNYIIANHLTKTAPIMVHYQQKNNDSLDLMMGIPVNKSSAPAGNVSCMRLTPNGRMVTTYYKGSFSGRAAVYKAHQRYISDHFLRPAAVGFEKYLNNSMPVNDSSQVEILLCSPVF